MGNYILSSHQTQVKKKLIFPKFLSKISEVNLSGPTWSTSLNHGRQRTRTLSLAWIHAHSTGSPLMWILQGWFPKEKQECLTKRETWYWAGRNNELPILDSKEESDTVE